MAKRVTKAHLGRAIVQPTTLNEEAREVEVVFATETPVTRYEWEDYDEVLSCEQSAIRWERINKGLPVIDCHNDYSIRNQLGKTVKVWINERKELCAVIRFSKRADVEELFQDIKDGIITDISVGYRVYKFEKEPQGEGQRPIYRAIDWMPTEISFAPVPADINSGVRSDNSTNSVEIIDKTTNNKRAMKKARTTKKRTSVEEGNTIQYTVVDEPVKAGDIVTTEDGQKGVAIEDGDVGDTITLTLIESEEGGEAAEAADAATEAAEAAAEVVTVVEEAIAAVEDATAAAEVAAAAATEAAEDGGERMNKILISTRAAGLPDTYAVELFRSNKPIEHCRHAVIKIVAKRNKRNISGSHGIGVGTSSIDKKRAGIQNVILHRVMPANFKLESNAREFRGMTLVEMGKELLAERGISIRGLDKMQVADKIFGRAHSTSDFPLLLEGVVDKMLRADYEFAEEYWGKIARQISVSDFREKALYQVDSSNGMKEVKEGDELKYTTLVESKQSIRIKSFAEGIKFTRQAFINDDLGAFMIIPQRFVKDWDESRGDNVWGLITNNVKMGDGVNLFDNAHNNLLTGANSALSQDSLGQAIVLFKKQKGIDGKRPIRVIPKFLIVPPELELTARKLVADVTATRTDDVNVFANTLNVIVEPRLTDPTAWYLAADPNAIDSLYYAYLEGSETLRVNSEDDFNTDTMKYAVRGDFGVTAADFRGLVKSKGKA